MCSVSSHGDDVDDDEMIVLFFSRPRFECWPHDGRTFSIHLCPPVILIDSSTGSPVHILMLPILAVHDLPHLVHMALFLALSLSPGNSLVSSWCDHSMLASAKCN